MVVKSNKIFGIGLSKTGTKSLSKALRDLGFKSKHFPSFGWAGHDVVIHESELIKYEAFADTPVAYSYKSLDKRFPGSKFILTIRDPEDWIKSCELFFKNRHNWGKHKKKLTLAIYNTEVFDRDKFILAYERHYLNTLKYFSYRKEDLLILNICNGEGWNKICKYLAINEVPGRKFPRVGVKKNQAL